MGRFRYVYVRWEELALDPTTSPGSCVLQYLKLLEIFKKTRNTSKAKKLKYTSNNIFATTLYTRMLNCA